MTLTVEQLISYLQITGIALAVPAVIFLSVAIALGIATSPRKLKQRIKELKPPPLPPMPEPPKPPELLDLSSMKRVIRSYIPYDEAQELARLLEKANSSIPAGWEATGFELKGATENA